MSEIDQYKDLLSSVREEWDKSESYIKEAEQVNNAVVFPSIKELRYAGRRIIDALYLIVSNGNPSEISDLLRDARFDCHRARHDAIDAATSKIAIDLEIAVKYLGPSIVLDSFPKYRELVNKIQRIRKKIAESREERTKRENIYSSIEEEDFPGLLKLYYEFKNSESLMQKAADKERKIRAYSGVLTMLSIVIAIVSAIIAFRS